MTAIPRYVSTSGEAAARIAGFVFGDGNPDHTDNPLGPAIAFTALDTTAWTQSECVRCAGILGWTAGNQYRIASNGNFIVRRDSLYAGLGITDITGHDLYHKALGPTGTYTPTRVQVEAFGASVIETEGSVSTNPPKWFDEARGGTYTQRIQALVDTLNTQSLGAFVSGNACKVPLAATDAFPMPLISAARYPGDTPADWPDGAAPPPDTTPPAVPTGLAAVAGVMSVALTWTVNTDSDLAGYRLFRNGVQVYQGAVQSFLDTGLTAGVELTYTVASYDTSNNQSAVSSPVFATPTAGSTTDTTPPDAPSNLTATPTSSTVALSWVAPAATDVVSYRVYNGVVLASTVAVPVTNYTVTGLTASTTYTFSVVAVDAAGNPSTATPFVSATTLFGAVGPPAITQERIDIVSAVGCATEYDVYVLDRSGTINLRQLPFTGLSWGRVMDDVSTATINMDLTNGSDPEGCCTAVQGLYRYAYEIGIYRDTFLVWQGPVVEVSTSGENIEIRAEDKMGWLKVRPVWSYLNYPDPGEDCAVIFNNVIDNAMLPDNVPGLVGTATPTGIRAAREYLPNPPQIAFDAVQELARTGVDYTMFKAELVAGSFVVPASPIAYFTDQALADLPQNEWLGTNFATQVLVTGDPEQDLLGSYGGIDPLAGLVVRVYQEDDIKDQASLDQNAKSRWELMSSGQLLSSAQIALDPSAPLPLDLAVPGAVIDLRLTESCFPIYGRFRLLEVDVQVSGSSDGMQETVTVTIEPVGTEIVT